jgi:hypothetical protein
MYVCMYANRSYMKARLHGGKGAVEALLCLLFFGNVDDELSYIHTRTHAQERFRMHVAMFPTRLKSLGERARSIMLNRATIE